MDTSPKSHSRVECYNHFMLLGSILTPRGTYHETSPDVRDMIVIFPGIGPIFLIDHTCLHLTNKMFSNT